MCKAYYYYCFIFLLCLSHHVDNRYLLGVCDIENKHYWSRTCYHIWEMYSQGDTLCEIFRSKIRCKDNRRNNNSVGKSLDLNREIYEVYPNEVCQPAPGGLLKCKRNVFQWNKCVLYEKIRNKNYSGIINWRCKERQLQTPK
ncbi:unnamed protein product [Lepeophtheirus salmonis]|uniref:(salmon louse) hypothetical protein n=1 Tax=Lepeophtheirus salmonis TaxID=72036 RepID=A0A7R8CXK8_LEPSM|nr:unnamed protein product [Lepeophtheirus salmonis]CAF2960858.1 unnamed protein product [Lepeophtheirus salmonis]